ncbi:IS21-like element helper ATPase IstB [Myroides albus]|uniref:IS21-like element helper ATPase IstB n=1 Tax=Myroides albus TaxID=2562892 RepID=UPI0021591DF7|nr:IS21-like element helper ATPase IstB [Myroides albus]UVD79146.1 IS21-like element helper ATPase IstB [Myroides albus]
MKQTYYLKLAYEICGCSRGYIKQANFRQNASIADINYTQNRGLDKNAFNRLASLDFVLKKQNIILTGASGVGKSYLAQALGYQACLMEHKVLYFNTANLFNLLKSSKIDGTYQREIKKVLKCDLLILDDFGLQPFDNLIREALFDIVDQRYNQASIILSSQIPVSAWYDLIGENTIADAVLDRIVNSSHRINLNGESMRKTNF